MLPSIPILPISFNEPVQKIGKFFILDPIFDFF